MVFCIKQPVYKFATETKLKPPVNKSLGKGVIFPLWREKSQRRWPREKDNSGKIIQGEYNCGYRVLQDYAS